MAKKLKTFKMVIKNIRLASKYISDPKVPILKKALLLFPLIYIISPLDLVPEILLPFIGWLDDTAIALVVWNYMFNLINKYEQNNDNEYTLDDDEYKVE